MLVSNTVGPRGTAQRAGQDLQQVFECEAASTTSPVAVTYLRSRCMKLASTKPELKNVRPPLLHLGMGFGAARPDETPVASNTTVRVMVWRGDHATRRFL